MDAVGNFCGTISSCGTHMLGTAWEVRKTGNTETGGAASVGTVYEISKSGKFTLLHSFDGTDGKYPYGSFVQNAKGTVFGTTQNGGTIGYGTVWKITK